MSSLIYSNIFWPRFWIFYFLGKYIYKKVSFKLINELYLIKIFQKSLGKIDYVIFIVMRIRVWTFLNLNPFKNCFPRYNKSENGFNFFKIYETSKNLQGAIPFYR